MAAACVTSGTCCSALLGDQDDASDSSPTELGAESYSLPDSVPDPALWLGASLTVEPDSWPDSRPVGLYPVVGVICMGGAWLSSPLHVGVITGCMTTYPNRTPAGFWKDEYECLHCLCCGKNRNLVAGL